MAHELVLLWFEPDVDFCTSMIRLLQRRARARDVCLVVRTATTEKRARMHLQSRVDCILCDVSANGRGERVGLRFVQTVKYTVPTLVLSDDLDLVVCARINELEAKIYVKRGAMKRARVLADAIIDGVAAATARPSVAKAHVRYREHQKESEGLLVDAFEQHGRNLSATARALGLKRQTLQSRLEKLGLR